MSVRGGIYIDKGVSIEDVEEFALCIGKDKFLWFAVGEDIHDLYSNVEHGGIMALQLVEGYSFGLNKTQKQWRVRDTGHKQARHILWCGNYTSNYVEQQLTRLHSILFY